MQAELRPASEGSRSRDAIRRWVVALAAATVVGCGGGGSDDPSEFVGFPLEKTAADFPGTSYPTVEDALPRPSRPVWLIGLDGASWDLILPMVERGELPTFASLLESGAHGVLTSEDPTISPALWATIATGMPRFEHGVVNFLVRVPGSFDTVEAGPPDRRSPAIWELVGAAGGSSAVIGWFGSYPAEEISGYYISKGFDPEDPKERQVHPESFVSSLRESPVRMRRDDLEGIAKSNYLRDILLRDARTMAALRAIVDAETTDLTVVYLSGVDVVQHVTWKHMDPASQEFPQDGPADPSQAGVIPAYYAFADNALREMLELAPEGTTFVIVSDHGAGPMRLHEAFHLQLEVLLETMQLEGARAIDELYRNEKRIWTESREQARAVRKRLEALRTDDGQAVFDSITEHARDRQWHAESPALTVRFSGDALFAEHVVDAGREIDMSPVRHRYTDVSGAHRLEGIVLLHGPAVEPGPLPEAANIYQVAPTLLYLLGLPQDERMLRLAPRPGGVLESAFRAEALERDPVRMVAEYPNTDRTALLRTGRAESIDPTHERALEQLRSLGYVR